MARGAKKGINRFETFQKERRTSIIAGLESALIIAKKSMLKFDSVTSLSNYASSSINDRGLGPVSAATLRKNAHYRLQLENFISKTSHPTSVSQSVQRIKHELEISQLKDKIKTLESFISKNLAPQPTPMVHALKTDATSATAMLCQLIERLLDASEGTLALENSQIIRPYAISKAMRVVADKSMVSIYLEQRGNAEKS